MRTSIGLRASAQLPPNRLRVPSSFIMWGLDRSLMGTRTWSCRPHRSSWWSRLTLSSQAENWMRLPLPRRGSSLAEPNNQPTYDPAPPPGHTFPIPPHITVTSMTTFLTPCLQSLGQSIIHSFTRSNTCPLKFLADAPSHRNTLSLIQYLQPGSTNDIFGRLPKS
jgi:hypothetical protein